jgi:hypothetical protein
MRDLGSILAFLAAVAIRVAFADEFELGGPKFHRVLIEESTSKAKCESQDDRIFVETKLGTECVAYFRGAPAGRFLLRRRCVSEGIQRSH